MKSECPPIDILINNGGTILRKPAAEHPDEFWDKIIEVDLSAQFVLAREFGRDMLKRERGKIVFTASLLSFQGGITVPGYAAAKGGVAQAELYQVFNMGIGMVLLIAADKTDAVMKCIRAQGQPAWLIGQVAKGRGIARVV